MKQITKMYVVRWKNGGGYEIPVSALEDWCSRQGEQVSPNYEDRLKQLQAYDAALFGSHVEIVGYETETISQ